MRHRSPIMLAALSLLSLLTGCVSPRAAQPVARSQIKALAQLASAHELDIEVIASLTKSLLNIQRSAIRLDVEEQIVTRYITPAGEPDEAALQADLDEQSSSSMTALAREVQSGRFSQDKAASWLRDYVIAARLSTSDRIRGDLVAQLSPMREHDAAAAALLGALESRAQLLDKLLQEARASAGAILDFTSFEPNLGKASQEAALQLWELGVVAHINDPARRQAAQRALSSLLTPTAPTITASPAAPSSP